MAQRHRGFKPPKFISNHQQSTLLKNKNTTSIVGKKRTFSNLIGNNKSSQSNAKNSNISNEDDVAVVSNGKKELESNSDKDSSNDSDNDDSEQQDIDVSNETKLKGKSKLETKPKSKMKNDKNNLSNDNDSASFQPPRFKKPRMSMKSIKNNQNDNKTKTAQNVVSKFQNGKNVKNGVKTKLKIKSLKNKEKENENESKSDSSDNSKNSENDESNSDSDSDSNSSGDDEELTKEELIEYKRLLQENRKLSKQLSKLKSDNENHVSIDETKELTEKWTVACQDALNELHQIAKQENQISMTDMLNRLQIPPKLVRWNKQDEEFE